MNARKTAAAKPAGDVAAVPKDAFQPLRDFVASRSRPVAVMYWPSPASMTPWDTATLYREFRRAGLRKEQPLESLDLLLETLGGDPSAAYAIAQGLRLFCKDMTVIVPNFAYSAGTLLAFGGNRITLGDNAVLSPIDITLTYSKPVRQIELAAIDALMDFAKDCRKVVEEVLEGYRDKTSTVESDVLVQVLKDIGALEVGKYYRERKLMGDYATVLLPSYLFKDCPAEVEQVVRNFLFGAPHHSFHMDYNLCRERGLSKVDKLDTDTSDKAKAVIDALDALAAKGEICKFLNKRYRMPYIGYFPIGQQTGGTDGESHGTGESRHNGHSEAASAAV